MFNKKSWSLLCGKNMCFHQWTQLNRWKQKQRLLPIGSPTNSGFQAVFSLALFVLLGPLLSLFAQKVS